MAHRPPTGRLVEQAGKEGGGNVYLLKTIGQKVVCYPTLHGFLGIILGTTVVINRLEIICGTFRVPGLSSARRKRTVVGNTIGGS